MKNFGKEQLWVLFVIVGFIVLCIISSIGFYQENKFILNVGKFGSMLYAVIILFSLLIGRKKK